MCYLSDKNKISDEVADGKLMLPAGAIRESFMEELAPGLSLENLYKISTGKGNDKGGRTGNITEKHQEKIVQVKTMRIQNTGKSPVGESGGYFQELGRGL